MKYIKMFIIVSVSQANYFWFIWTNNALTVPIHRSPEAKGHARISLVPMLMYVIYNSNKNYI